MSETTPSTGISKSEAAPGVENRSFHDILKSFVGKTVTVVNPESYEGAPIGYALKTGFYKAKVSGMGRDYIVLITEFAPAGRKAINEPAKQFVPIANVKRVSMTKSERILHI